MGHTICFVDDGFGLLKQQYRKSDIDTVEQLATAINDSCHFNEAMTSTWQWHQWDTYLSQFFNPVGNITKYQNFYFSAEQPGKVQLSGSSTLENTTVTVLKPGVDQSLLTAENLLLVLEPAGLMHARTDYLYKQIRQHCHKQSRDITCPVPQQQERQHIAREISQQRNHA